MIAPTNTSSDNTPSGWTALLTGLASLLFATGAWVLRRLKTPPAKFSNMSARDFMESQRLAEERFKVLAQPILEQIAELHTLLAEVQRAVAAARAEHEQMNILIAKQAGLLKGLALRLDVSGAD